MKVRLILSFIFISMITTIVLMAQPGDPGGNPDVPITGIEILLGLGGALGVKRLLGVRGKSKKT